MGKKSREKRERRDVLIGEPWEPLVETVQYSGVTPEALAASLNIPVEEVRKEFARQSRARCFVNNLYVVLAEETEHVLQDNFPAMIHITIRRQDRGHAKDWRHFQLIKNQIVGPENEGVELFPAESRLVDTANQFHIWVFKDPEARFPFGYVGRALLDHDPVKEANTNTKQRKFQ